MRSSADEPMSNYYIKRLQDKAFIIIRVGDIVDCCLFTARAAHWKRTARSFGGSNNLQVEPLEISGEEYVDINSEETANENSAGGDARTLSDSDDDVPLAQQKAAGVQHQQSTRRGQNGEETQFSDSEVICCIF